MGAARTEGLMDRGWPKPVGSLKHDLALREACGEPAGRRAGPDCVRLRSAPIEKSALAPPTRSECAP